MTYDLLIKGGTLIDPAQDIQAYKDVAFGDGVAVAWGKMLGIPPARPSPGYNGSRNEKDRS